VGSAGLEGEEDLEGVEEDQAGDTVGFAG